MSTQREEYEKELALAAERYREEFDTLIYNIVSDELPAGHLEFYTTEYQDQWCDDIDTAFRSLGANYTWQELDDTVTKMCKDISGFIEESKQSQCCSSTCMKCCGLSDSDFY